MNLKKKLIVLSILCSFLVYLNSPFFPLQFRAFANDNGSTIGGVSVSGMKEEEIRNALSKAIEEYISNPIEVSGAGTSIEIDSSKLQFNIDATLEEFISQTGKPWYAFWESTKKINIPLQINSNEEIKQQIAEVKQWETESTYNNLILIASLLRSHDVEAKASEIAGIDNERIAVAIAEIPSSITDVQTIIDFIPERIIASGEEISFLDEMSPILGTVSRETVSFVSSTLYQTALRMDAQIIERSTHTELPSYIQPGLDAFVSGAQNKNLRFVNSLSQPVMLKVSREGINLKMEVYAASGEDEVSIRVTRDQEVEPRTITRYSLELPLGKSQEIQKGKNGLRVTVYHTSSGEERVISRDYYPPTNTILLKSARVPATSTSGDSKTGGENVSESPDLEESEEDFESIEFDENGNPIEKDNNEYDKGGNIITNSGK